MSLIKKLFHAPIRVFTYFYYKTILGGFGWPSLIISPLHIDGNKNIYIGKNVLIQYKTWLAAVPLTNENECRLIIEDGCIIGHFNHIYATKSIIIHKDVLTADKVYISDNLHGYEDIHTPIRKQSIIQNGIVEIGEGSWIGENVCVLGACIGKHCVIGANSVVTHNIPDYSIAVGAPAKVIKRYDLDRKEWIRIKEN